METERLLKELSLESSREILKILSDGPKTAMSLREESDVHGNRASFYKSLNRLSDLGIVDKRYDPEAKRNVFELRIDKLTIDLKRNRVEVKQ